ncbi:uncharacterized protein LOC124111893 [Haliotis rufescens]|uniref:uncharacterized protein LOC124111893 n=1 Tax=Haliotis rufescens TaxID=6454 RepID=UPI001EB05E66|nr:uncharacterized protein LOC124111893 [Haliotis rufescens]
MLKQKEVIHLLDISNLPGSLKSRQLAAGPKDIRKSMIQAGDKQSEDVRISAAIEIQRRVRGYKVRCAVYNAVEPKTSNTAVYSDSKQHLQRLKDVENLLDYITVDDYLDEEEPPTEDKMMIAYEEYMRKLESIGVASEEIPQFDEFCTVFLQIWESKKPQESSRATNSPSPRLQQRHYQHQQRQDMFPQLSPQKSLVVVKKKREGPIPETDAVIIIQRAWRRHIDIQVYRYYRDLINFRTRGDPGLMLRCINPNEAKMLDSAAGIHVRFRLAGERFPPNIYYKIFTHRTIVDMCANSPKDYTRPEAKQTKAKDKHTKNRAVIGPGTDKDGWYQRVENNGWRLVSDRLIHHIMSDPVTWQTSNKKYEFHHDKLARKQDVEKRRKQKKIDWMKKMYRDGMLKAKADDYETVKLIEGAAAGMVATVEASGPEALEEWEVDELLDWTTSLNFDDYWTTWKDLATSSHSEAKISDRLRIATNNMDPYEFSLSTGPSRFQSTRQSHNTPVSTSSGTKIHVHVNS